MLYLTHWLSNWKFCKIFLLWQTLKFRLIKMLSKGFCSTDRWVFVSPFASSKFWHYIGTQRFVWRDYSCLTRLFQQIVRDKASLEFQLTILENFKERLTRFKIMVLTWKLYKVVKQIALMKWRLYEMNLKIIIWVK